MPEITAQTKASQAKVMWFCGAGLFLLFGVLLLAIGAQKSSVRSKTEGNPQSISLGQLAKNGPGSNKYVELDGFNFGDGYALEKSSGGNWTSVWVPLFVEGRQKPVAIAQLTEGGQRGIEQQMRKRTLKGLVSSEREQLTGTIHDFLSRSYSNIQRTDKFWMFKCIESRPDAGAVTLFYAIGFTLLVAGAMLAVIGMKSGRARLARTQGARASQIIVPPNFDNIEPPQSN